jgi:hypothetical protein
VKNVVNRQQLLFTNTWRHSKFSFILCTIRGEKHPRAFVKVVEGSEIYNFPIHHFVHFYSNFWSFKCSNRGAVTQGRAGRRHATPRLPRRPRPMRAFPRSPRAFPTLHVPRCLVLRAVPYTPRIVHRSAAGSPARAPVEAARRTAS